MGLGVHEAWAVERRSRHLSPIRNAAANMTPGVRSGPLARVARSLPFARPTSLVR